MKKRIVLVLCVLAAMAMLTACGKKIEVTPAMQNDASTLISLVANYPDENGQIKDYSDEDREFQLAMDEETWKVYDSSWQQLYGVSLELDAYQSAIQSYMGSQEELGHILKVTSIEAKRNADKQLMTVCLIDCEKRDGTMYVTYNDDMRIVAIKYTPNYTFGENMGRAALNTLMGMGVVFVVLILISLIISLFSYIPKLQAALSKKKDNKEEKNGSMDNTIQQIISKEEDELADDCELVAVIAAAIAAYEGTSTDGFVVRSIKKSAKWQRS